MFHIQTKSTIFVSNYGKEHSIVKKGIYIALLDCRIQIKTPY